MHIERKIHFPISMYNTMCQMYAKSKVIKKWLLKKLTMVNCKSLHDILRKSPCPCCIYYYTLAKSACIFSVTLTDSTTCPRATSYIRLLTFNVCIYYVSSGKMWLDASDWFHRLNNIHSEPGIVYGCLNAKLSTFLISWIWEIPQSPL